MDKLSKQVFISYPRDNAAGQTTARALFTALQKEQISAFLDEDSIELGDRWLNKLKQGVADCKIMLSVISAASDDRAWLEKEFNEAQKHDIRIIPILAEAVDLPMQFTDIQAIALYGDTAKEQQEKLFKYIRKYLGIDEITPLIKEAEQAKRNDALETALQKWQQVLTIAPDFERANKEISRLEQLRSLQQRGKDLLPQLLSRMDEIQPVFGEVATILSQASKRPEVTAIMALSQQFLENSITSDDYTKQCKVAFQSKNNGIQSVSNTDYAVLAERIGKGEMVMFLGSDIAQEYGVVAKNEQQLAKDLAQQAEYPDFEGGLSSITEYLHIGTSLGARGVWEKLESAMQKTEAETRLHTLLAKVEAPLILISAAYDNQLERCFDQAGKLYVQLSSIICPSEHYDVGHVVASYSDGSEQDQTYLAEELSALKLHEKGYSIIYKIRGSCVTTNKQSEEDKAMQRDGLTVTESNYFTFARHAETIIPSYLASLLRGRGFLFVGFSPESWEQRLLVNTLLSKRKHAHDRCHTVGVSQDPLEAAFWRQQGVVPYDVNLPELDGHIEEVLR